MDGASCALGLLFPFQSRKIWSCGIFTAGQDMHEEGFVLKVPGASPDLFIEASNKVSSPSEEADGSDSIISNELVRRLATPA